MDQSYWQGAVAASPKQGVLGFLAGGLTWFAVPFVFATTMGLGYLALSEQRGAPLLRPSDVDRGTPLFCSVPTNPIARRECQVYITIIVYLR